MKFRILNRVDETSLFREALLKLLTVRGKTLILGYGYMTRVYKKNSEFLNCLACGFDGIDDPEVILIGKHGETIWSGVSSYCDMAKNIVHKLKKKNILNAKVRVLLAEDDNYHKKIALKLDKNENPICAIIGSSNLTGYTFNEIKNNDTFNLEVDIVFWTMGENRLFHKSQLSLKNEKKLLEKHLQNLKMEVGYSECTSEIQLRELDLKAKIAKKDIEINYNNCAVNYGVHFEIYGLLDDILKEIRSEIGLKEVYTSEVNKTKCEEMNEEKKESSQINIFDKDYN